MPDTTPPVRWTPDRSPETPAWPVPPLLTAVARGFICRCPACGQTRIFKGWLRVVPACLACGAPLGRYRADDAPPYFTIFAVGHIVVPLLFMMETSIHPPLWVHAAIWLPTSTGLAALLLRPIKGATVGLMLKLGMVKAGRRVTDAASPASRLVHVVLAGESLTRLSPLLEADRAQAVADLEHQNHFALCPTQQRTFPPGPYLLHLSVQEGRLVLDVRDHDDTPLTAIVLALGPFRSIIKDYQLLVDSHMMAVEEGRAERIQAIDMGRRGLHDEGASLLRTRLQNKADIDHETARRLFTLVCVLHQRI